jgi:hypothetical protein
MLLSPSLWIAIYDPTLNFTDALANGYTRMVLINANGMTAINLGLNRRQAPNTSPAYDYQLSVSTIPAASVDCAAGSTTRCHISLFLQFPSFDRQNSRLGVAMEWEVRITLFSFVEEAFTDVASRRWWPRPARGFLSSKSLGGFSRVWLFILVRGVELHERRWSIGRLLMYSLSCNNTAYNVLLCKNIFHLNYDN